MHPEHITEVIRKRRAIFPKTYINTPISKEVIQIILENANWAPTHRFTEPWRFKVFTGDSRAGLGNILAKAYKKHTPEEAFSEMKFQKAKMKTARSSCIIAICMQRDPEKRVPKFEEIASVSCAVQNMWLTATAYNIGAYWSSPGIIKSKEVKRFLDLNKGERCLGFFYMGHHNLPELPGKRGPIEDKVVWRD